MDQDQGPPARLATLAGVLRFRAALQGDDVAIRYLRDGELDAVQIGYAGLDRAARRLGQRLAMLADPGDRVVLVYPPGLDFVVALFGCWYAGLTAVPVYPPRGGRASRERAALAAIAEDAQPRLLLADRTLAGSVEGHAPDATILLTDDLARLADDPPRHAAPSERFAPADALAMIQYTSGSTGAPRGVLLSHANLLANNEHIRRRFGHTAASRGLIWLPAYHDMGLIGGILQPLYAGFPVTLMSPMHFLQQPVRWLEAVSRTGATTSGGPNFAYELCLDRVTPQERDALDLSTWDVAFVGAEPVRAETLDRFAEFFAPCGFRREAFYPCYGLAEGTLLAAGGQKATAPVTLNVSALALERNTVVPFLSGTADTRRLVSCGRPLDGHELRIVDPHTCLPVAEGTVGEIWLGGACIAGGYWRQPEATQLVFEGKLADTGAGPFLRTGDLGFLQAGELFITGRLKDLVILQGRNHYPQDLERTVEASHEGVRAGGCAAFSVDRDDAEVLVVVAEVERTALPRRPGDLGIQKEISTAIRRAVAGQHDVRVSDVVLVRPATVGKTTSGKVRRRACRDAYLAGQLERIGDCPCAPPAATLPARPPAAVSV